MNKTLKGFLIVIAIIAGLGIISSLTNTSTSTNTSEVKADTETNKAEFMKGCNAMEGVDLTPYCTCTWNALLDSTTDAEFNAMMIDYANEPVSSKSDGLMNDAVDRCSDKI